MKISLKKINWKKFSIIAACSVVVLAFVGYFVVTSSFFLRTIALPIAGSFLKMEIKADSIQLSGLSKLTVTNLKVTPNNEETILEAGEIMAELNGLDLSFASFSIKEVYLDKGVVNIVQTPTGGNLAAILALMGESDTNKPPMQLALDKLTVKDSTVKWKLIAADDSVMGATLDDVNITGAGIGNEKTGDVALNSALAFYMGSSTKKAPENEVKGQFTVDLKVPLQKNMMPGIISGTMKWDLPTATGMFAQLQGYNLNIDMGLSLEEIQKLVLNYNKGAESLVKVAVDGKINLADLGVTLNYDVSGLDSRLLNVFAEPLGLKLEKTLISSKGMIQVADSINTFKFQAESQIKDLVLVTDTPTPIVSLESDVDISANLKEQSLSIAKFYAKGLLGEKEFLSAGVSEPIALGWGESAPKGAVDSSLEAKLNIDLADWRNFLSDAKASGVVSGDFSMNVKEQGSKIGLDSSVVLSALNMLGIQASGKFSTKTSVEHSEDANQIQGSFGIENLTAGTSSMGITNFVFNTDYQVGISSDGVIDIPSVQIAFQPAAQAQNKILVNGKLDLRATNAAPSSLNVQSDGVDITKVLDWAKATFASDKVQVAQADEEETVEEEQKVETVVSSDSSEAIQLPIKQFDGKVLIAKFYAGDILVTNIVQTLALKDNQMTYELSPMQIVCKDSVASVLTRVDFNLQSFSGKVHYEFKGIDENILNPIMEMTGMKIAEVNIGGAGDVILGDKISSVELNAQTSVKDFQLAGEEKMPVVSLESAINVVANMKDEFLRVSKMDAKGLIGTNQFLAANLSKPLSIGWGEKAPQNSIDSSLKLELNVDVGDWQALLQDPKAAGNVKGIFDLGVADEGNNIKVNSSLQMYKIQAMGMVLAGEFAMDGALSRATDNENKLQGTVKVSDLSVQNDSLDIADFSAGVDYNILLTPSVLDVQKMDLSWKETDRAENKASVTGKIAYADLAQPSRVKIVSKSMDFTPQLAWLKSTATDTNAVAEPTTTTTDSKSKDDHSLPLPKTEPAAIDLPIKDFECDFDLGVVYLKQMFVSNMVANINIKTNVIGVETKSLNINGGDATAAVRADLNQPGYKYKVDFNAPDGIPAGPIFDYLAANIPGELSQGKILANASISGAGITEAAIQKNLYLQTVCGLTNVSFNPINTTYKVILTPVLTALRISDIADSQIVGLYADLNNTNGVFSIRSARVITEAFEAEVTGNMNLNPVLMDSSMELPVTIYLEPQIADDLNLATNDQKTNSIGFLAMPNFVKINGSPADFSVKVDPLVVSGLLLKSGTGVVGDVGSSANKIVGGVGGLLVGDTNNTNGVKGLVQDVGGLIGIGKKSGSTNEVDQSTGTDTNKSTPLGGVLNLFKKK